MFRINNGNSIYETIFLRNFIWIISTIKKVLKTDSLSYTPTVGSTLTWKQFQKQKNQTIVIELKHFSDKIYKETIFYEVTQLHANNVRNSPNKSFNYSSEKALGNNME